LKVITQPLENRQMSLTIEVDEERTMQTMRRASRQIARQVNIPGFRKGKAPYEVILQRFGEDTLRREAADLLAKEVYREALDQEGIEPYGPGELDGVELNPITFRLTVPLSPLVDLGNYRDYRLDPPEVTVSEKEVEEALEKIREEQAYLEPVERPLALNDGVVLDLVAKSADGVEILKGEDVHTLLEAGSSDPAPGFAEAIVGMVPNEIRVFTLTLPDTFPQEEFRGQEAEFTVRVTEVYDYILPELDDDLARAAGNFASLEEMKEQIRDQLRQAAQAEADRKYAEQVVAAIIEQAQVEYPPAMLEKELDAVLEEAKESLRREAKLSLEDYLRIQGQSLEEFREALLPRAAARLKRGLVLAEVIELEGIELADEEINARIEEMSAPWGSRADAVRTALQTGAERQALRNRMLAEKAIDRLVAIARGETVEPTPDEEGTGEEGAEEEENEGTEEKV